MEGDSLRVGWGLTVRHRQESVLLGEVGTVPANTGPWHGFQAEPLLGGDSLSWQVFPAEETAPIFFSFKISTVPLL